MKRTITILILALILMLPWASARADEATAREKGLAIAKEADKRDEGFKDFTADLVMTLKNKHGQESIRKLRIRTLESKAEQEWVALTGARPGPSSFPELYNMLKTGVFDGYDGNFTVHDSMKYYEVTKYVTIMGYHNIGPMILINQKVWDGFTPAEKKLFQDAAHQAMVENYAQGRRMVTRAREVALKHGNQIIEELEDRDKWIEAVQPYIVKVRKMSPDVDKYVKAVEEYHKKYPRWPIEVNAPVPKAKY